MYQNKRKPIYFSTFNDFFKKLGPLSIFYFGGAISDFGGILQRLGNS